MVINNHKKKEEFREITQVETKIDKVMSEVGTKPVIKKVCATIIRSKCSQGLCKNDIMKKLTALKKTKWKPYYGVVLAKVSGGWIF